MNCSAPTGFIKNFTKANSPIKPDVSPLMFPYFAADKIMSAVIFLFGVLIFVEISLLCSKYILLMPCFLLSNIGYMWYAGKEQGQRI